MTFTVDEDNAVLGISYPGRREQMVTTMDSNAELLEIVKNLMTQQWQQMAQQQQQITALMERVTQRDEQPVKSTTPTMYATRHPSTTISARLKAGFDIFSGTPKHRNDWPQVYQARRSALGYVDALKAEEGREVSLARPDIHENSADPDTLQNARQVLCTLITSCQGMAAEIVQPVESPSEASSRLVRHYHASGLKERRRLTVEVYTMKMNFGEHLRKLLLRLDRIVKDLKYVGQPLIRRTSTSSFSAE